LSSDPLLQQRKLINVGGVLVEQDALRIAERIHEYDPNLKVVFLNDAARSVSEPPYKIVERCKDGVERPVLSCWKLDETVFQKLFLADTARWDVSGRLDGINSQARQAQNRRYKEQRDEAKEIVTTVLKSPKSNYTVPETVVKGERGEEGKKITFSDTPHDPRGR